MSHAHRKVAWVKRRGAAVRQRRAMRNGAYLFGKRYTPVPWNAPVVATPVADIRATQERIAQIRTVSLDEPLSEQPDYTDYRVTLSPEATRKIAAMFPMEDSHAES